MKNLFDLKGASKKNKRGRIYGEDWDAGENYAEDAEVYEDEEYYEEDEYAEASYEEGEYAEESCEDGEYAEAFYEDGEYAEEFYEEDEYAEESCEDGEYAEASYEEDEYTDELYGEDGIEEEAFDGEIIYEDESDSYEEEDAVFYEEEEEDDEEGGIFAFFGNMGLVDKLILFAGAAVLLIALLAGGIFFGKRLAVQGDEEAFAVGSQLTGIETIGESGLLAVSDAQKAAIEAAKEIIEEEEPPVEYEEEEYKTEVTVRLSMTSIEKDLKIKFINLETGKLVGNVPFAILVKDANGKESLWSDDDMDGIIYKKNLSAGNYKVTVQEFEEEKYKKFGIPSSAQSVEVKAALEYKKVDVANEVKSESQVDVQKEDTKKNETVVESFLTDTVTWVESTATLVSFTEVAKSHIQDPLTFDLNKEEGEAVSAVSLFSTVTGTVSGGNGTTTPTPTPTPEPMVLKLDREKATVYAGVPFILNAVVENEMEGAVITAKSSDTSIATVEVKDKAITVTGLKEGTVQISVDCTAEIVREESTNGSSDLSGMFQGGNGMFQTGTAPGTPEVYQTETITCTITVKRNPKDDKVTILQDIEERDVYVLEGDTYRPAYYADYYTYTKFYVKGDAKYTGWQTIEGKRYYFDATGKKVTGEQVIQGVKYQFASDGSLVTGSGTLGIDVSKWNGNIDWTAVKNSGVSYVIIRCGYRGSSQGALIKDSKFETNIQGAINAGLKVGVYFFTQAIDKNEAIEEASMVLDCIKQYKISYPVFLDVEASGGRADKIDKKTRTEICKTFCETIQQYGYTAGIYANKNWLEEKIDPSELGSYKIWLAQYASSPTYSGRYEMWQYKSTGKISGISGDVDMNISYLGY